MQDVNPGGCLASVPVKEKGLKRSEHGQNPFSYSSNAVLTGVLKAMVFSWY